MQHATQQLGVPFARPTVVSDVRYVYDIEARSGLAIPSIHVADIDAIAVFNDGVQLGDTGICPLSTGACIASAAGGAIEGWDMYGQFVREVVAAAGTTKIAFAGVTRGPADMLWTNKFGLPYKYLAAATGQDAQVTITPPAADGDARGTFVYAGAKKVIELRYIADRDAPFGAPYATRFMSGTRVADVTMVGTINTAGVIAITKTLIADDSTHQFYTMPDGQTIRTPNAAGPLSYTLPALWMSKYARTITDVDTLVRGGTPNGTTILVNLTGAVAAVPVAGRADDVVDNPPIVLMPLGKEVVETHGTKPVADAAKPALPPLPVSFSTHAMADNWLDAFVLATKLDEPEGWFTMTLPAKYAVAQAAVKAIT